MTRDLSHKQFIAHAERQGFQFVTMNGLGAWLKDMQQGGNTLYGCLFTHDYKMMRRASLASAMQGRIKDLKRKAK